ncbi:nucleotidyltransferase domain-containing protein [Paucibacter soli]|uniref:nucleotidyltransferase domain-containing protein n=1 Tax=Paucibacter soli TaxID=3133433 RepID=UPI0030B05A3C
MSRSADLVGPAIGKGQLPAAEQPAQWELLLHQARSARLQARLAQQFRDSGQQDRVPAQVLRHFEAALTLAESQRRALQWEVHEIQRALRPLPGPVVLLKGAAYVMAGLQAARGRIFSDVDVLVPRASLNDAEAALMLAGWHSTHHDAYDQRYYRQWMHEIPPMLHNTRATVIDLHHNILPLTSRIAVDAGALLAQVVPIEGWPGIYRLGDADMVLHSACHLFLDGEFDKGLRDLCDIDALLREFGARPEFWQQLPARAEALGLSRMLFHALRQSMRVFGTPVPAACLAAVSGAAPAAPLLRLMDAVLARALRPEHASCSDAGSRMARQFLYLRAHWMRMPLGLLLLHLGRKALRGPEAAAAG